MAKRRTRRMRKRTKRRRGSKSRKSRRRRGGSVVGALKTALLPFLLYKAQKHMQKRKGKKLGGRRTKRRR